MSMHRLRIQELDRDIYGVKRKNRVSRVNIVSKEDALDFIEHDQSHNVELRSGCF